MNSLALTLFFFSILQNVKGGLWSSTINISINEAEDTRLGNVL